MPVLLVRRRRQGRERGLGSPGRTLSCPGRRAVDRGTGFSADYGAQPFRPGGRLALSRFRRYHPNPLLHAWRGSLIAAPGRACQATSRENTSGSILPPDSTATAILFLTSTLPCITAASATAPPGSTTSFNSAKAKATAAATSSSLTATPAPTSKLLMAKVSLPGMRAINASQIVPVRLGFSSRRPLRKERA